MPKQSRLGAASSDSWKRQLPQDIRDVLIYIETVCFKDNTGLPNMVVFIITETSLLITDNKAKVVSKYNYVNIIDYDRSSNVDSSKMFIDPEIQGDVVKYYISIDEQNGDIPNKTEFYTYFFDSQINYYLKQTWLTSIYKDCYTYILFPLPTFPVDISSLYILLEKQFLSSEKTMAQKIYILEELCFLANYNPSKVLMFASKQLFTSMSLHLATILEAESLTIEEVTFFGKIYFFWGCLLQGSENVVDRSVFMPATMDTLFPLLFTPIPNSVFPSLKDFVYDSHKPDLTMEKFETNLALIIQEFDISQAFCLNSFIPILEQRFLTGEQSERVLYSFDALFAGMLQRFNMSDRLTNLFERLIDILKELDRGTNFQEDDELTLRMRGVEEEQILENVKRNLAAESKERRELTPQLTIVQIKRLSWILFTIATVIKRLIDRFPQVKDMILKKHKVNIQHYLQEDSDDPILERIDVTIPIYIKAENIIIGLVEDLLKNIV